MSLRNSRIDLLRGMSILLVVLDHAALRFPPQDGVLASLLPQRLIDGIFNHGYEAVFIFFVISGYLITSNALASWQRLNRIDLRTFYARRVARIMPSLLALVGVLCLLHLCGVNHYVIDQPGQTLRGAASSALGMHLNWYEGRTDRYLPASWDVLWSLSIEEAFYIAFPMLCLCLRREWLLAGCLAVLAVTLPWSRAAALSVGQLWEQKAYLPGMSAIAIGVLTALVATRMRSLHPAWMRTLLVIGCCGIGAILFADDMVWRALHQAGLLMLTASVACLLLAFGMPATRSLPPLAGTAWIASFGRLSYEIYLSHMFVVFGVLTVFRAMGGYPRWSVLWIAPTMALTWLLGKLIELSFSAPCNRALRTALIKRSAQ